MITSLTNGIGFMNDRPITDIPRVANHQIRHVVHSATMAQWTIALVIADNHFNIPIGIISVVM